MFRTSCSSLDPRSTSIPVRSVKASSSRAKPASPRNVLAAMVTVVPASARTPGSLAPYESSPPRNGRFSGISTCAGHDPERNESHSASVSRRSTADSASSTNSSRGRAYTPTRPLGPDLTATGVSRPTSYCTPSSWSAKCTASTASSVANPRSTVSRTDCTASKSASSGSSMRAFSEAVTRSATVSRLSTSSLAVRC